ncbi:tRNA lysidine(34) synthetase TilS [Petrotoga sp. 9PWA.NaAc.5.4]|uniref:tRNA lysidine(34) synthetase TilS n=1 Tax=Petrotoga sp. 9PWA.NaAc.5.4 TaxID=1434328 RepID=UPI000CB9F57F|nr:tRNA lysidine(34) synthetase TilS [Petrotoga sp. 9PWA.NaAc.5.4]PNR96748.1 tRNA(Ile)-lysidine synthetase [Petrotoga sp. 9PWA.NaAc.5.4]
MILQSFDKKILKFIKDYKIFNKYDKILLGISGGKDSMSLLNTMNKISKIMDLEITVAHLNHGMREEALEDEIFVRQKCEELNIPFFSERKNVFEYAKREKISVEVAGRTLRYEFFYKKLRDLNYNKIATAHHKNDLAETILYRIIRGTGFYGIGGLTPIEENLAKPMLCVDLEEITNYVTINSIDFVEDVFNYSLDYSRNKIRHEILPKIKGINPKYEESFFRLAKLSWNYRKDVENKYHERVIFKKEEIIQKLEHDFFDVEVFRMIFLKSYKYPPNMEETEKALKMKKDGKMRLSKFIVIKKDNLLIIKKS